MTKIFISWYDGQNHKLANEFLSLLKEHDFDIEHSPHSPHSGYHDERWGKWYEEGLPQAIHRADSFIAVITPSCDASSWMMMEYDEAYKSFLESGKPKLYFIRFDTTERRVKYPEYYLQSSIQLSSVPADAVHTLAQTDIR
jgi:hypothetical protein